jgi:hypothetical protein
MHSTNRRLLVFVFILTATVPLSAQDTLGRSGSTELRTVPNAAFAVGERLVFDIGYSFIIAGEAVFSVPQMENVRGRDAYQILFTVESTPTFSWIYRVDDRYETIVDKEGLFPWRFTQRIREGKYRFDFAAQFDQVTNTATTEKGSYPIPPYVHDAVSAFFYVRSIDFSKARPGEKTFLSNFYKDTSYTLAVKFLGRQQIEVEAGTFNCIIVEPMMKEGGLFKNDGRILIWMTDDERKIPVKVSTKVVVGSIDAELREYSGINGPIQAKVE